MRSYLAVFSARLRMLLQYRAAAFAGLATQLFWGLIRVMIFEAFYRTTTSPQPMNYAQVVDYVWLGQALLALLPIWMDTEVRAMMRNGTVVYELVRPLDLYNFWYARALASRLAPTLLRALPLGGLALLFFGLAPPVSPAAGLAWLLTVLGALLLGGAISTLLNISLMWTIAGEGIFQIVAACVVLLSGMIVPLPFFPDWMQVALKSLPFAGLVDLPFRLYTGHIPAAEAPAIFAGQLAWTAALVGLGRLVLRRGIRRLVVQGG
ncbi:MAG: ABC-2 family transporter protein [Candidatus Latescibacteria bacterium]|nr:ABC-2 family transporter protein [Candidatus Latescibacterota bacterium]